MPNLDFILQAVRWDFHQICHQRSLDACSSKSSIITGTGHTVIDSPEAPDQMVANQTFIREAMMMVDFEVFNHENSIALAVEAGLVSALRLDLVTPVTIEMHRNSKKLVKWMMGVQRTKNAMESDLAGTTDVVVIEEASTLVIEVAPETSKSGTESATAVETGNETETEAIAGEKKSVVLMTVEMTVEMIVEMIVEIENREMADSIIRIEVLIDVHLQITRTDIVTMRVVIVETKIAHVNEMGTDTKTNLVTMSSQRIAKTKRSERARIKTDKTEDTKKTEKKSTRKRSVTREASTTQRMQSATARKKKRRKDTAKADTTKKRVVIIIITAARFIALSVVVE